MGSSERWVARLLAVAALVGVAAVGVAQTVELPVPAGVTPPKIPEDNPPTQPRIQLGQTLYFDARISTDGTVACATCHDPGHAFVDPRGTPTSAGVGGALGTRNAPTVLNAAFLSSQFWDGRAATLEDQAVGPLENPVEHGFADDDAVLAQLRKLNYQPLFDAAFGSGDITMKRVGQAIASFERTLLSLDAPIDRFLAGDATAIPEDAKRGWVLFNSKALCVTCHGHVAASPLFTDNDFHNLGVGVQNIDFTAAAQKALRAVQGGTSLDELALTNAEASELGRFMVTRETRHMGAFKTPQLRNIARTAPYMHDGSEATLRAVIEFYDRGGNDNPHLDARMQPLGLTEQEKTDLVALLETFTSDDLDRFGALFR